MITQIVLKIDTNKEMRFKTSMLRSYLCDFSDGYIIVKGEVTVTGGSNNSRKNRSLAFKNNVPFIGCISKINNVLIENAGDFDIVMPMYNLMNTVKITEKQQKVCAIITEMN